MASLIMAFQAMRMCLPCMEHLDQHVVDLNERLPELQTLHTNLTDLRMKESGASEFSNSSHAKLKVFVNSLKIAKNYILHPKLC